MKRWRNKLIKCRQEAGLSQKNVADYLGITERGYKFIEYGDRLGSIEIWDKLEDLFSVHQRLLRSFDQEDSPL